MAFKQTKMEVHYKNIKLLLDFDIKIKVSIKDPEKLIHAKLPAINCSKRRPAPGRITNQITHADGVILINVT